MSDEVIFYDLAAKDGKAWSLNPWKSEFAVDEGDAQCRSESDQCHAHSFLVYSSSLSELQGHTLQD